MSTTSEHDPMSHRKILNIQWNYNNSKHNFFKISIGFERENFKNNHSTCIFNLFFYVLF